MRRVHRGLVRARDAFGVVDTTASRLASELGGRLCNEDVPLVLAALERTGALVCLPHEASAVEGTEASDGGSQRVRVGVRSRADLAWANELRQSAVRKLDAVERYARGRRCRRAALLRYFGEASGPRCEACDRCHPT